MDTMRFVRGLCLIMLVSGLLLSPGYAEEIIFQDEKGVQTGTVLSEDEKTVTVRFSKETIKSIVRGQEGIPSDEKMHYITSGAPADAHLQEKLGRLQERIELLEKNLIDNKKAGVLPVSEIHKASLDQLLQEEMGRVEGVILWKRRPLTGRSVMIVLEKYTGFSLASLKKMFSGNREKSSDQITFETKTDSQGRYVFEGVPPGQYRVHFEPDKKTGWIHRMREKPDFEVIAGKLIIQNIPDGKE